MGSRPAVLLLDDGELEPVLEVLETMEVPFLRFAGKEIPRRPPRPRCLLLTSANRAIRMPQLQELVRGEDPPVWIAFHNQDFLPFRQRLRRMGVRFLVQSSVGPETVRLLLEYALYRGSEKRDVSRLPADARVTYEIEGWVLPALLVELSSEGCRLRSWDAPPPEGPVVVHLPPDLGGGRPLPLVGRVVRSFVEERPPGEPCTSIAILFGPMEPRMAERLKRILDGRVIGTLVTRLEKGETQTTPGPGKRTAPSEVGAASPAWSGPERRGRGARIDRRLVRRASYPHAVTARIDQGTIVLLGRDLSIEGIRVERHPILSLGVAVRLALYGGPLLEPLVLSADVVRDDGEAGFALRFGHLDRADLEWLESIVYGLPSLEALSGSDVEPGPVVLSRILPDGEPVA